MNLQKGLRFTDTMRRQLAVAAAEASFTGQSKEFNDKQKLIADQIMDTAYTKYGMNRLRNDKGHLMGITGLVPEMTHFPVKVGEIHLKISLNGKRFVPFAMFNDPKYMFSQLSEDLRDDISDFAEESQDYVKAYKEAEAKIYQFVKQFSSPKMLLGSSPEFGAFIPKDWQDDEAAAEGTKSLADILAA